MTCLLVNVLWLFFLLGTPPASVDSWSLPLLTSDPHAVLAAANRYTPPDGADAFTLDYSVRVEIDPSGKMHRISRTVTRVLRVQGVETLRRVYVPWEAWRENRPKLAARVITSDGAAHLLDPATVTEAPTPGAAADAPAAVKILSAALPAVDVDSIIEVESDQSDREPAFAGRFGEITVASRYAVAHFSALVSAASPQTLQVDARGFAQVKQTRSQTAAAQSVAFDCSQIPPPANQPLAPPEVTLVPTIGFSTAPDWAAVARRYAGIIDKAAAPQTVTHPPPTADRLQTIEHIFEDIQKKVRSTPDWPGTDAYAPHTPAETLVKGQADSTDKAVLLIGKLAEVGIPARAALLSAAPHADVLPRLPGLEAFDRLLVYVPGDRPLWIDPAAEFTPPSRLPSADQGRLALIADSSTTDLVRTPASIAAENRETDTIEIQLHDGSAARLVAASEYRGAFEDLFRPAISAVANAGQDEKNNFQDRWARAARAERITSLDLGDPKNLLAPCRLQFVAQGYASSQITDEGGFIDLPGPASINFQQFAAFLQLAAQEQTVPGKPLSRKIDYYIPPPFIEETRYRIVPPPGYRLKEPPSFPLIALGPATLSSVLKTEADGSLSVAYTFTNPKSRYTPQEAAAILHDFQKLSGKAVLRLVLFNIAEEKIANGDLKEGIALLKQNAAAPSSNTNASLRLASAFAQVGARAEAVKLCENIIARDPKSAGAYARLAWAYTHDEFGRPFQPGMDLRAAEKAYLKAIELDPAEKSYPIQLAIIYTYDSAGVHYGKSARLDAAIEQLRQAGFDALAKYNAVNDYALALLIAKRYDDLKQFFLYSQAANADQAIKLAAIAASSGTADVLEEAQYLAPSTDKQKVLLLQTARYLLIARQFRPAAALLQTGASAPQSAAEIDLREIGRARNFDQTTLSKQPAVAAVQRLIAAVFDPIEPDDWKKLVVPEASNLSPIQLRAAFIPFAGGIRLAAAQTSNWPFIADVLTTALDFTAEGDDASGFRIRAAEPGNNAAPKTIAYVVKRNDDYLVLGLFGSAASSAEALANEENGNLAAARIWLNWAKDEFPPPMDKDPFAAFAFERFWPPAPAAGPAVVKTAAAILALNTAHFDQGMAALKQLRGQFADPELQNAIDAALAKALLARGQYADAVPLLEQLQTKWPNSESLVRSLIEALIESGHDTQASALIENLQRTEAGALDAQRLRARLFAHQAKFAEAAALDATICANAKATGFDWNDRAWLGLFTPIDPKLMRDAAEKALELTHGRNPSVLQTLAVVQASTGKLQDARANAYRLADQLGDSDEVLTVFGRIAEELDLRDIAAGYYRRVKKPQADTELSNYAFAQMRLRELAPAPARARN